MCNVYATPRDSTIRSAAASDGATARYVRLSTAVRQHQDGKINYSEKQFFSGPSQGNLILRRHLAALNGENNFLKKQDLPVFQKLRRPAFKRV
jgi:hypothetical protein